MIIDAEEIANYLLELNFQSFQLWQDGPIHDEIIQFFVYQYEKENFLENIKDAMEQKEHATNLDDDY